MALNWNLTRVADHESLCWRQAYDMKGKPATDQDGKPLFELDPITNCLIWGTMLVEIGKLTEENYVEFHRRLEVAFGYGYAPTVIVTDENNKRVERIPTLDEVKAHVGLSTNVYARGSGLRQFNTKVKRWEKERKAAAERQIFPEDTTDADMEPEKLDPMGMVRASH